MSVHVIKIVEGAKVMRPVETAKEYLKLRGTKRQQELTAKAREGDTAAKQKLLQMNYSCLPDENGRLKGSRRCSTSVGMDIDLDRTAADYEEQMKQVVERVMGMKEELGLLMLEVMPRYGLSEQEMPDTSFAKMPHYGRRTQEDESKIQEAVTRLRSYSGYVDTPRLRKAIAQWVEEQRVTALKDIDHVKDTYRRRAAVIGFRCGVI